jgi:hypothetical protein
MELFKITENAVVTGSDRGKSAANIDYVLYIVGFFIPLVALVGVIMAYINRGDANDIYRTQFNFQIRLFWRGILFWVAGGGDLHRRFLARCRDGRSRLHFNDRSGRPWGLVACLDNYDDRKRHEGAWQRAADLM